MDENAAPATDSGQSKKPIIEMPPQDVLKGLGASEIALESDTDAAHLRRKMANANRCREMEPPPDFDATATATGEVNQKALDDEFEEADQQSLEIIRLQERIARLEQEKKELEDALVNQMEKDGARIRRLEAQISEQETPQPQPEKPAVVRLIQQFQTNQKNNIENADKVIAEHLADGYWPISVNDVVSPSGGSLTSVIIMVRNAPPKAAPRSLDEIKERYNQDIIQNGNSAYSAIRNSGGPQSVATIVSSLVAGSRPS